MTQLTTVDAVQKIIQYDTTLFPDLTPFIESASLLVTDVVGIDPAPSDAVLELVTRYLTAHLLTITEPLVSHEQVKSLQATYQFKLSDGLGLSHWGSTALLMDTTGRLSRYNQQILGGHARPTLFWSGTENSSIA